MTLHAKVFISGLLAATLPTMAVAQVVPQPVPAQVQPVQAQPAAVAADGQQQTQQAITHALGMAIRGSELQFIAQSTRGGRSQDQNADNNQNRRDRDNDADNNQNRRDRDNADNNQNRRDRDDNANDNNQGRRDRDNADNDQNRRDRDDANNDADNQGRQQAARQAVRQLQQQARHQFEGSTQLLQAADNDLRALEGNAAPRPGDPSAWSRRLHAVASRYADTLRDLSGVNNRPAGSVGGQNDQDQARRGDQDRDRGQDRREGGNLSRAEIAQATLINHAVCEALGAYQLNQATGANRVAAQTTAGQQLQAHARQMAAESRQILQDAIAGANRRDDNDAARDDNRRNDDAKNRNDDNRDNARGGRGAQGQASVRSLAQQAQQVIDTLQRIGGGVPAPAGAVAPGAVR
jgi:hypothetical protein